MRDQLSPIDKAMAARGRFVAFAFSQLHSWQAAEDVVQEAFVIALDKQEAFDAQSVLPWMFGVVRNKCHEARRARRKDAAWDAGSDDIADMVSTAIQAGDEDDDREWAHRRDALHACMEGLTDRARTLLSDVYWSRRSCEELAAVHGRRADALRMAISRLRRKLKDCIERRLRERGEQ